MTIQYVTDEQGNEVAVILPIQYWREIRAKLEITEPERGDTEYLLGSKVMKDRLLESLNRSPHERISWEEVKNALGL